MYLGNIDAAGWMQACCRLNSVASSMITFAKSVPAERLYKALAGFTPERVVETAQAVLAQQQKRA